MTKEQENIVNNTTLDTITEDDFSFLEALLYKNFTCTKDRVILWIKRVLLFIPSCVSLFLCVWLTKVLIPHILSGTIPLTILCAMSAYAIIDAHPFKQETKHKRQMLKTGVELTKEEKKALKHSERLQQLKELCATYGASELHKQRVLDLRYIETQQAKQRVQKEDHQISIDELEDIYYDSGNTQQDL